MNLIRLLLPGVLPPGEGGGGAPGPPAPPSTMALHSQAGLRGVGRGPVSIPVGGRASDAAIVALHVRGGLIVAAVSLCLRIK